MTGLKIAVFVAIAFLVVMLLTPRTDPGPEVIVLGGPEEVISWLEAEDWWGEESRGAQLQVPYAMITGISERWQKNASQLPVEQKKEIFYRFILPLVAHANAMVEDRRARLESLRQDLESGKTLAPGELEWLQRVLTILRIKPGDDAAGSLSVASMNDAELLSALDEALYRLDIIPAGLVLGQAAYESGYGTSRFAVEGNALFGQWSFGGEGLVPQEQRREIGDHRIASFEWPFDSVRSYFINLSSHPAYEDLRRLRAELKSAGKPVSSIALADGLSRYSERGQEYVDTLKGIIRNNNLEIADNAVLRNEPMRFVVGADGAEGAAALRAEIESMRASGELTTIVERMRLE